MRGRATLVIAHRLSTIERADRILVWMRPHRRKPEGMPISLPLGIYARLHRLQYSKEFAS